MELCLVTSLSTSGHVSLSISDGIATIAFGHPKGNSLPGDLLRRLAEVVRYESDGKHNYYRLKHPGDIRQLLASLSRFVKAASKVPARDR